MFLSGFLGLIALFIIAIYHIGSTYSRFYKLIKCLYTKSCSLNTKNNFKIVFQIVSRSAARRVVRDPLKSLRIDYRGVIYRIGALPVQLKTQKSEMATTTQPKPLLKILLKEY